MADMTVAGDESLAVTTPAHVLVVDDDEMIRVIARAVLEKAGMRVSEAADGDEALACLEREAYSALLLDLDMPRVGGLEVLRSVRLAPATADLPVIVLTGSDADQDRARILDAGASACMHKPIAPDGLLAHVTAVLRAGASS